MKNLKKIKLNKMEFGSNKLIIIAGPCAIESEDILLRTAEKLKDVCQKLDIDYIFKASYDKANRTSIDSYRGIGISQGLELLAKIKKEFDVPVLTDIHTPQEAAIAAEVVDIIQIPAFLSRQTDILIEAAKTGKIVNIKKGQFLSPQQIIQSAQKVEKSGNDKILITERGNSFGYNNLVVDMRVFPIVHDYGYPMIFDATHSVQLPGGGGTCSSGQREFVAPLANAAIAAGADAVFFEIHPDPDKALCDGPNMLKLDDAYDIFAKCSEIFKIMH